jgi:hypothetical protein
MAPAPTTALSAATAFYQRVPADAGAVDDRAVPA